MKTASINQKTRELIGKIYTAIEQKKYDEATKYASILQQKTDNLNPEVIKANHLIFRGKAKNDKNSKKMIHG